MMPAAKVLTALSHAECLLAEAGVPQAMEDIAKEVVLLLRRRVTSLIDSQPDEHSIALAKSMLQEQ